MTHSLRTSKTASRRLLARILGDNALVASVRDLPPRALAQLIEHVGLEDSGELIALASTEQLSRVFDEDLWRSHRPGEDETFDARRFGLWIEIMLEAGASFAAHRLAELSEDFLANAFHHFFLVVDLDELAIEMSEPGNDEYLEKALDSCLHQEFDRFRIMAKKSDHWDALVDVALALDEGHHDLLSRVLERCAHLSGRDVEDFGGLYEVLSSEEMLASDVSADREDRRAGEGFVAPSSARSFLRLAEQGSIEDAIGAERDFVTRAYFRDLSEPKPAAEPENADHGLLELLKDYGVLEESASPWRPRLAAGKMAESEAGFRAAMEELRAQDPKLYAQRLEELAFLANVLVAGADPGEGRSFRPAEAGSAAIATCAIGLEELAKREAPAKPQALLTRVPADILFRLGWRILQERGGNPASKLLISQGTGS